MTFYEWMMERYLHRDTPRDYELLLNYLIRRHACSECLALFKRCWRDYQKMMACHA